MERQWIQEAPGRPPGERARALFGRAVTCLGFCVMGLLAIPAALCLGLIYLVWQGTNALSGRIENSGGAKK